MSTSRQSAGSKKLSTNAKHRLQREKLHQRYGGLCHWCGKVTRLVKLLGRDSPPPDMATIDHLDDRYNSERGKRPGEFRRVLACWQCNHDRNVERQRAIPVEVLRERAGNGDVKR